MTNRTSIGKIHSPGACQPHKIIRRVKVQAKQLVEIMAHFNPRYLTTSPPRIVEIKSAIVDA